MLLVDPIEVDQPAPGLSYDEHRDLTVDERGRAFVELGAIGETHTLTEVRGERDDEDESPSTFTLVQAEGADRSAEAAWGSTVTFTKAAGEADDSDDLDIASLHQLGTKTMVRAESEDLEGWAGTITATRVANEHDDQD